MKTKRRTLNPSYYKRDVQEKIHVYDNSQPRTNGKHYPIAVVVYGSWSRGFRTKEQAEKLQII